MFDPTLPRGGEQKIPRPPAFSHWRSAPWVSANGVGPHEQHWSVEQVVNAVRGIEPVNAHIWRDDIALRDAAVLCGVTEGSDGAEIILTKRSSKMRTHKGEISFPGGRLDEGETPLEGALRESLEEIGLDPKLVTPIGQLNHVSTVVSTSYIVPIVGEVAAHDRLQPTSQEVEKVLYVPVRELLHPETFREEAWEIASGTIHVSFFDIPGETIYGATARMLFHLMSLITGTAQHWVSGAGK